MIDVMIALLYYAVCIYAMHGSASCSDRLQWIDHDSKNVCVRACVNLCACVCMCMCQATFQCVAHMH